MTENSLRFRGVKKEVIDSNKTNENEEIKEYENETKIDMKATFWLTRIVFLRALAFIYFIAFLVSYNQNKELIGDKGLLPMKLYLSRIKSNLMGKSNLELYFNVPTLYWFLNSWENMDPILDLTALIGMVLSFVIFVIGCANRSS